MNLSSKEKESGKKKKKGQSLRARGRRLHRDRRREEGSRSEKVLRDAVARNLPSLTKDVKLQVQETKRASRRISGQQSTLHHIIIKCLKSKQRRRFLEAERDGLPRGERGGSGGRRLIRSHEASRTWLPALHVPAESRRGHGLCVGRKYPLRVNGKGRRSHRKSKRFPGADVSG